MPRSASSAATYIANLQADFANRVGSNTEKEQEGLPTCEVPLQFPIFMQVLTDNQYYATLTDFERDSIIDYEQKIINQ